MQFWTPSQLEEELLDHPEGVELGPGASLSRRSVLKLSGAAAVWLMLPAAAQARALAEAQGRDRDSLMEIVAEVHEAAVQLVGEATPNEDEYVALLSRLMRRMPRTPIEPFYGWRPQKAGYAMDTTVYSAPIVLFQIKMEPGGVIALHDHRHYNGVLMGMTGEVEVNHYNVVKQEGERMVAGTMRDAIQEKEFTIRGLPTKTLRPGEVATLTRDRDNIHEVRGGAKGGILLDLFTYFSPQARSYELTTLEPEDKNGLRRVAWSPEE